jgi:hypothetical protein
MIVPKILLAQNQYGPDTSLIPEKYSDRASTLYRSETDDYLVTIQETEEEKTEKMESLKAVYQLVTAERILDGRIKPDELDRFEAVFDYPQKGKEYKKDWILRDEETGKLKVIEENFIWDEIQKDKLKPIGSKPTKK